MTREFENAWDQVIQGLSKMRGEILSMDVRRKNLEESNRRMFVELNELKARKTAPNGLGDFCNDCAQWRRYCIACNEFVCPHGRFCPHCRGGL